LNRRSLFQATSTIYKSYITTEAANCYALADFTDLKLQLSQFQ
jgi:hypothetical protein